MNRYAAKIIFQFRHENSSSVYRTTESRIINFVSEDLEKAYDHADGYGLGEQFDFINDVGEKIFFDYIGVVDLIEFSGEVEECEVWYDIKTMKSPMERKGEIVPTRNDLLDGIRSKYRLT